MTISIILAWIAVVLTALSVFKFMFRGRFHRLHKWVGFAALPVALIHGLLAGNPEWSTLSDASIGEVLFSWNTGTFTFLLMAAVVVVWLLRSKYKKQWFLWHRLLSAALAAALVCHITAEGIRLFERILPDNSGETAVTTEAYMPTESTTENTSVSGETTANDETTTAVETYTLTTAETTSLLSQTTFAGAMLTDGVFTGSGQGYRGTITVEVTVENGKVTAISTVSSADDERFYSQAFSGVTGEIIDGQALDVDAVSGATYSSHGVVEAVSDALTQAVISGELDAPSYDNERDSFHR